MANFAVNIRFHLTIQWFINIGASSRTFLKLVKFLDVDLLVGVTAKGSISVKTVIRIESEVRYESKFSFRAILNNLNIYKTINVIPSERTRKMILI